MKFTVNIDQSFIEQARRKYKAEPALTENSSNVDRIDDKENQTFSNAPTQNILQQQQQQQQQQQEEQQPQKKYDQQEISQENFMETNKFSTSNLLLEGIHQSKIQQHRNKIHLQNFQDTIEDAFALHLTEQVASINSYAPKFNTPQYNCVEQYKGLHDCYTNFNGGYKCDAVFKDFMRCYRNTRRQYFDLREL